MPRSLMLAGVCLAMLLAGCQAPPAATTPVFRFGAVDVSAQTTGTTVYGRVQVPAGVIQTGHGNMAAGSIGQVISTGGGNVIATGGGNYRLQALDERPLIGAEVVLCDAAGVALPGVQSAMTDLFGQYTLVNVPRGGTYVLRVSTKTVAGKEATLQTLVKPVEGTATADITMGSTVVSTALLSVHGADVDSVTGEAFQEAVRFTEKNLNKNKLPDLGDPASLMKKAREISAFHLQLKAMLAERKAVRIEAKAEKKSEPTERSETVQASEAGTVPMLIESPAPALDSTQTERDAAEAEIAAIAQAIAAETLSSEPEATPADAMASAAKPPKEKAKSDKP